MEWDGSYVCWQSRSFTCNRLPADRRKAEFDYYFLMTSWLAEVMRYVIQCLPKSADSTRVYSFLFISPLNYNIHNHGE